MDRNNNVKNVSFYSEGSVLRGIFHYGERESAVVMAHGSRGDKSEDGKLDRVAYALQEDGLGVLRFDFSGCGESDDAIVTDTRHVNDLRTAINFARQSYRHIGLLGYSRSGLVALKSYDSGIGAMVLWAPRTTPVADYENKYTDEQRQELSLKGYVTRQSHSKLRETVKFGKEMARELASIDQKELLSPIECPVLIIHGDKDQYIPVDDSKKAVEYLNSYSQLQIFLGVNHFFMDQQNNSIFDVATELTRKWFVKHLP